MTFAGTAQVVERGSHLKFTCPSGRCFNRTSLMASGAEEEEKQLEKTQEEEESRARAQENKTAVNAVGASQFLRSLLETGTWSEEESQEVLAALQPLSASEVMELGERIKAAQKEHVATASLRKQSAASEWISKAMQRGLASPPRSKHSAPKSQPTAWRQEKQESARDLLEKMTSGRDAEERAVLAGALQTPWRRCATTCSWPRSSQRMKGV